MDGRIARHDDPIWSHWRPPNGYNCRCRLVSLREGQAQRFIDADRRRLDADPDLAAARASAQPDKGWAYDICDAPGAGIDKALEEVLNGNPPTRWGIADFLKRAAGGLLSKLSGALAALKRAFGL